MGRLPLRSREKIVYIYILYNTGFILPFEAKMSNIQENLKAGESQVQDTANAARNKTADATQSTKESAQQGKDQSAGFLQQTGEQVKNMAQGAVGNVKSTLGMGDKK